MPRAGRYRQRVAVQKATAEADTFGEEILTWTTAFRIWCSIKPLSGSERVEAAQVVPGVTHEVKTRARDGITPDKRLLHNSSLLDWEEVFDMDEVDKRRMFGSKLLEIASVIETDERGSEFVLSCMEDVES